MSRKSVKPKSDKTLRGNKHSCVEDTNKNNVTQDSNNELSLSTIKSSQLYTKQVFEDFAKFTVKNNKSMIVIYVCSAIILLCAISMFVINDILSGVLYIILGLFFAFYGQFIKLIMRLNNKKNYDSVDYYEFTDDALKVTCKDSSGVEVSSSSVLYSKLFAVKRYANYGYIYVNKAVAYIVTLENFKDVVEFNYILNKIENEINQEKFKEEINKI